MSSDAKFTLRQNDDGGLSSPESYSQWVRLGTLVFLRWLAILGQTGTVMVARLVLGVQLDVWLCGLAIGLSALTNIVATVRFPASRRLSETESMLMLMFDTAQLAFLLGITGGLNNPFALLILAPTTIAATALQGRPTVYVGAFAIGLISLVAAFHRPLLQADGTAVEAEPLFAFGIWLALVIGVVFLSLYARMVAFELHAMASALMATQMALAREQRLTALGGVVAAAAHELGTPLATIKLISTELRNDLADRPEAAGDAAVIAEQADRCRDILRSMGSAGKEDTLTKAAPLSAVLREAAGPHTNRGKTLHFPDPLPGEPDPVILRLPEVIHGLRNLIQNATDFAREHVWIDVIRTDRDIMLSISDDGAGFPAGMIGRIGDPFIRRRQTEDDAGRRPGYEGMGLGLFIAKTLLERTGAQLGFANGADPFLRDDEKPTRSGAIVTVAWPRRLIEVSDRGTLDENRPVAP